jgi:hypothetical protein
VVSTSPAAIAPETMEVCKAGSQGPSRVAAATDRDCEQATVMVVADVAP